MPLSSLTLQWEEADLLDTIQDLEEAMEDQNLPVPGTTVRL